MWKEAGGSSTPPVHEIAGREEARASLMHDLQSLFRSKDKGWVSKESNTWGGPRAAGPCSRGRKQDV